MIRKTRCSIVLLCAGLGLTLAACSSQPTPPQKWSESAGEGVFSPKSGHLLIIGGGLRDDNAEVYGKLVALAGPGPIGVLPTASADGLEAGERHAATIRRHAGKVEVRVIPLTRDDTGKFDPGDEDAALVNAINSCTGLWILGGDQSRLVRVLRPGLSPLSSEHPLQQVLARGGVIGGTSAGAAAMSDPMIVSGAPRISADELPSSPDALRTGLGLGLLKDAITDQHFLQRGRLGRLIPALALSGRTTGLGVSEDAGCWVDQQAQRAFAIGVRGLCVVRLTRAGDASEAMISLMSSGDSHNLASGQSRFLGSPIVLPSVKRAPVPMLRVDDPWKPEVFDQLVSDITSGGMTSASAASTDGLRITLERTPTTAAFASEDPARPSVRDVRVRITIDRPSTP